MSGPFFLHAFHSFKTTCQPLLHAGKDGALREHCLTEGQNGWGVGGNKAEHSLAGSTVSAKVLRWECVNEPGECEKQQGGLCGLEGVS